MAALCVLDAGFHVLHTGTILFILFGWVWRPLRRANLAVIVLTGLSWTVLGFWRGFGYCPFTDWHWNVRAALGHTDMPPSYIKFLLDRVSGADIDPALVDGISVVGLLAALAASLAANWRSSREGRSR